MHTVNITITLDGQEPSEHVIDLGESFTVDELKALINSAAILLSSVIAPHLTRE